MAEHTAALKASPSGRRYFATLRAWLDDNDIALDADAFLGRPDACVVLIPRVLQPNAERVRPRYIFAGPCIDERRTSGWTPADGDERPLVYMAFGTAYTDRADIYRLCVEELAGAHRLVLATGKVDPAVLGPLPDGVRAARTQPQLDVLGHASVFITHAGMGSAAESLWFGVPTVAIPQAVDQFTNAAQLESIGAGRAPARRRAESRAAAQRGRGCACPQAAGARAARPGARCGRRGGRRRRGPASLPHGGPLTSHRRSAPSRLKSLNPPDR